MRQGGEGKQSEAALGSNPWRGHRQEAAEKTPTPPRSSGRHRPAPFDKAGSEATRHGIERNARARNAAADWRIQHDAALIANQSGKPLRRDRRNAAHVYHRRTRP